MELKNYRLAKEIIQIFLYSIKIRLGFSINIEMGTKNISLDVTNCILIPLLNTKWKSVKKIRLSLNSIHEIIESINLDVIKTVIK